MVATPPPTDADEGLNQSKAVHKLLRSTQTATAA